MSYGSVSYAGGAYASEAVAAGAGDALPALAVEVAFLTDALAEPAWVDITGDVRAWDTTRGRNRELERFQPGRATVVLDNRLRRYDSQAGLPAQYIDLPGTSGNYASTPDSAAVSITGDIDIRVRVAMDDWTPAARTTLLGKWLAVGSQRSYFLAVRATGLAGGLSYFFSPNGSTAVEKNSTAATGFTDGTTRWVRVTHDVDNGASGYDVKFYTSADDTNDPDAVSWTQLGSTVTTATATSIFDSTSELSVGARDNGTAEPTAGNVYYAEVRNGIDGTVVAKFDANTVPQTGTRTPSSWTSDTGEVWTINGSAWAWGGTWGTPWYGNLKPMRRMRIRETFNGVTYPIFDGFVDRWLLDYPQYGKDATATITATDAFKIFARTDLPRSVYTLEVEADTPDLWWRLDDPQFLFSAVDASGNGHTGTPQGNALFEGQGLIAIDPGSSLSLVDEANTGVFNTTFAMDGAATWSVEFWFLWEEIPGFLNQTAWQMDNTAGSAFIDFTINSSNSKGSVTYTNDAGGVSGSDLNDAFVAGTRYHVVVVHQADRTLDIYVNGALAALSLQGTTTGASAINKVGVGSFTAPAALRGLIDEFAVYETELSATRILAHFNAGVAPWNADLPSARADRILDRVDWPDGLRELDAGATSLQSATLDTEALEHLQKLGETEFGLLYVDRAGNVRLVARSAVFARTVPAGAVFGDADDGVEVAYRDIKFDDGDIVIRNRATIAQLNGVPATAEDTASVSEFGRFDFDLSGLYHDSLTHSQNYADFIVAEYKDPRRRVVSLTLGPAQLGDEDILYPQTLGRELGDVITVRNRPVPGGTTFEQTAVIEGIRHQAVPARGGNRGHQVTTWILSPDFTAEEF